MKNYVVGIHAIFEHNLKLFTVTAENEYEAVKAAMVESCDSEEDKQYEIDHQNSDYYPDSYDELNNVYEEMAFSVIEVGSFLLNN
ncbi:hypothetical protein DYBT9275_02718 [Dyadobacter sp. CECT 9275]|uniref:Uncharacterized protein n=1 Tax=Dyadobacter helix TaxID=2822344 RepID=A0A916N4P3_9BACT|nr:hypothetical protein [Dyadobacter sp. CECT 9275]CAG5001676.1 hypothetical protein DYBT9275_02718 [Dyadobacter sp. CECT 9275]